MVWAALTIILMQGVLAVIGYAAIRSFGAFSADFRAWTAALIRTHEANVRIHEHNDYLVDELSKSATKIRYVSDALRDKQHFGIPATSDQEKSA